MLMESSSFPHLIGIIYIGYKCILFLTIYPLSNEKYQNYLSCLAPIYRDSHFSLQSGTTKSTFR